MIELKTPAEIERMRETGQFVAEVLHELARSADVGVNLLDLEHRARQRIREQGAESCYWDYTPSFGKGPFRNVLCLSVNDAVLHGLPHDYTLRDGDVLSMDFAVSINGWVADAARSLIVGTPAQEDVRLVRTTERHWKPVSRRRDRGTGSVMFRPRSGSSPQSTAIRSTPSSAVMGWAGRCTKTRTSPTVAAPDAGFRCAPE